VVRPCLLGAQHVGGIGRPGDRHAEGLEHAQQRVGRGDPAHAGDVGVGGLHMMQPRERAQGAKLVHARRSLNNPRSGIGAHAGRLFSS